MIDRETSARASIEGRRQASASCSSRRRRGSHYLDRRSRYFTRSDADDQTLARGPRGDAHRRRWRSRRIRSARTARWAASADVDHETRRRPTRSAAARSRGDVTRRRGRGRPAVRAQRRCASTPRPASRSRSASAPIRGPRPSSSCTGARSFGPSSSPRPAAARVACRALRERFDPHNGNPALGPEMLDHAELRAIYDIDEARARRGRAVLRHTTGTIRASVTA